MVLLYIRLLYNRSVCIYCFVVDIFNNAGWLISIVILGIVKTTRALILVHLGELNRESSGLAHAQGAQTGCKEGGEMSR